MKAKIEKWYHMGLWSKNMIASAVKKGILTAEDYEDITGEVYQEESV